MPFELEPGKYTIIQKASQTNIGPASSGPRSSVGVVPQKTVFSIELAGTERYGREVYRIKLGGASVTIAGDSVVVDADIPLSQASLWIIESKGDNAYGIIPGALKRVPEPLAWTLSDHHSYAPLSLQFVPQTKSIPPYSIFSWDQYFELVRVD